MLLDKPWPNQESEKNSGLFKYMEVMCLDSWVGEQSYMLKFQKVNVGGAGNRTGENLNAPLKKLIPFPLFWISFQHK